MMFLNEFGPLTNPATVAHMSHASFTDYRFRDLQLVELGLRRRFNRLMDRLLSTAGVLNYREHRRQSQVRFVIIFRRQISLKYTKLGLQNLF